MRNYPSLNVGEGCIMSISNLWVFALLTYSHMMSVTWMGWLEIKTKVMTSRDVLILQEIIQEGGFPTSPTQSCISLSHPKWNYAMITHTRTVSAFYIHTFHIARQAWTHQGLYYLETQRCRWRQEHAEDKRREIRKKEEVFYHSSTAPYQPPPAVQSVSQRACEWVPARSALL